MAKNKTVFFCSGCGHEESKWMGRCPGCGEWNTFSEAKPVSGSKNPLHPKKEVKSLSSVSVKSGYRYDTGIKEVNQVLGGGLMKGSSALIGGEPGIGKSTLMLQIASQVQVEKPVLYISGEESASQIKMRSERLSVDETRINILCESDFENILEVINELKPEVIIIDSIQTMQSSEAGNVPGTVNQLKYCCSEIIRKAKESDTSIFFIAHVTKEGVIAGPKVVEHMVDTVLYFDHSSSDIRLLRAVKNRFGSIDELGLFTMQEKGLVQLKDPAAAFLTDREGEVPPGSAIAAVHEGSRVIMVEIQVLTVPAKGAVSRIFSDKVDSGRVSRIAAILEKHVGLRFSDRDIYVNIAGGIKVNEPGLELPLALALYSARTDIALSDKSVSAGELSLAGEIRKIPHIMRRVKTAAEMGFTTFISPETITQKKVEVVSATTINAAIKEYL